MRDAGDIPHSSTLLNRTHGNGPCQNADCFSVQLTQNLDQSPTHSAHGGHYTIGPPWRGLSSVGGGVPSQRRPASVSHPRRFEAPPLFTVPWKTHGPRNRRVSTRGGWCRGRSRSPPEFSATAYRHRGASRSGGARKRCSRPGRNRERWPAISRSQNHRQSRARKPAQRAKRGWISQSRSQSSRRK